MASLSGVVGARCRRLRGPRRHRELGAGAARWSDGACWEIGVALLPGYRGRGFGVLTHRALVDYLFAYTMADRIEAIPIPRTLPNSETLEKVGFHRARNDSADEGLRPRTGSA
jgi:RimJ/RimL family protein N-acetyltransferase